LLHSAISFNKTKNPAQNVQDLTLVGNEGVDFE